MTWQDVLIAGCTVVLNVVVLPSLLDSDTSIPRTHSVPTAAALLGIVVAHITLGLYFSAAATLFGVVLWSLIALLRPT